MKHGINSLVRLIPGFYIFYIRIFVPAAITSVLIALAKLALGGRDFLSMTAYPFFLAALAFQFILYEFMDPGQYYFYNNLGFTRLMLWVMNLVVSFLIFILLSAL